MSRRFSPGDRIIFADVGVRPKSVVVEPCYAAHIGKYGTFIKYTNGYGGDRDDICVIDLDKGGRVAIFEWRLSSNLEYYGTPLELAKQDCKAFSKWLRQ